MALRIALAQINATVGDLSGNRQKIIKGIDQARKSGAHLVAFPELAITGYPPEDLLLKPDFVESAQQTLLDLSSATKGLIAVIGGLWVEGDLYNGAAVFSDGKLIDVYTKHFLPNYGVFDENRYFQVGQKNPVFRFREGLFGISICEDIWYPTGPPHFQAGIGGAQLLINISSSPYYLGKGRERERMLATRAADDLSYLAYCNLIGGQDELIFDGQSMIFDPQGELIARGKQFEEDFLVTDIDLKEAFRWRLFDPRLRKQAEKIDPALQVVEIPDLLTTKKLKPVSPDKAALLSREAEVYQALVLGTGDYCRKNGFSTVVVGLSGGIDSSLTAAVAADALGPDRVYGIAMPTRYSSSHSLEDAEQLSRNLGIHFLNIPIEPVFQAYLEILKPHFKDLPEDLTEENLQPRIRGTLLMGLSNKFGWLVLTTGNKSEVGVGYSTLYGDTAGGFSVLKDVPKTLVYDLSLYLNQRQEREIIPQRVLDKPPSAELRPDQKDSDSLPLYEKLDPILSAYVEESCSLDEIVNRGFDREMVQQVIRMVDRNEYKRRQSPPGIKITSRAFGKDWRLPITNRYTGKTS
ncbi:MAG: NAD+ synthase [Deltaproteobacteria bacterium]|nr:NAD+ synthase [Deltaproteobacteria bacterium]